MSDKLNLKDFIKEVKKDLIEASSENDEKFLELTEVELEATFSVELEANAGYKFVVDMSGSRSSAHTHKAILKFKVDKNSGYTMYIKQPTDIKEF